VVSFRLDGAQRPQLEGGAGLAEREKSGAVAGEGQRANAVGVGAELMRKGTGKGSEQMCIWVGGE
jgi:hypothetical protein